MSSFKWSDKTFGCCAFKNFCRALHMFVGEKKMRLKESKKVVVKMDARMLPERRWVSVKVFRPTAKAHFNNYWHFPKQGRDNVDNVGSQRFYDTLVDMEAYNLCGLMDVAARFLFPSRFFLFYTNVFTYR